MNQTASQDDWGESNVYPFMLNHMSYWDDAAREMEVECGFVVYGNSGNHTYAGYGYPFKYYPKTRATAISTPFGPDGPIDADDIAADETPASSSAVPTQTASATGTAIATSTGSSDTALPTGAAGDGTETGTGGGGGLSSGAIAGIGAGAAVLVITIGVLAFLLWWKQRKSRMAAAAAAGDGNGPEGKDEGQDKDNGLSSTYFNKAELEDNHKAELEDNAKTHASELDSYGSGVSEVEGSDMLKEKRRTQRAELPVVERRCEVDGGVKENVVELP